MVADTRLSGNLDRVIEIARPTVADPEGDSIVYNVKRGGEYVSRWKTYSHDVDGNTIRLRLELGSNADFEEAVGVFPAGTDVYYKEPDGTEIRYAISRFHAAGDAFDYSPEVSANGQAATFQYAEDYEFVPGINQAASGAAVVVAELDRAFEWPEGNIRVVELSVGYASTPARDLFAEETRQAWARLERQEFTADGRETEWTIADPEIAVGDIILYSGRRLTVTEIEDIERSYTKTVTAIFEKDA